MVRATGSDNELAEASGCVQRSVWSLRGKPLIDVVMSIQYDIHIVIVQSLPDRLRIGACAPARAEERNMPKGQRAKVRVRGQILLKPLPLRRAGTTSACI